MRTRQRDAIVPAAAPAAVAQPLRSGPGNTRVGCRVCGGGDGNSGAVPAYRGGVDNDHVVDPFAGDPDDPAQELSQLDEPEEVRPPLASGEREDVLTDLEDLEVFQTLLEPRGVRGLVVDCEDCREPHYFDFQLLRANLRHLLDVGETRVHEPAFGPDPSRYVSWDYAHGFADGVMSTDAEAGADGPMD